MRMRWRPRSTLAFCALLAAIGVALRFLLADHYLFRLIHVPSHDMSQGIAFFATSMHSMRLSGDLAWWFPGSFTGYAQYYQGFFSPLAPTYGHIVFIAWAHLVAILDTVGIRIPEYFQYLTINYIVLPFLAFAAFAWFCSLVFRSRYAVALAVMVYVLSGIGLWHTSWLYYQEAFSVFFLLAASIAMLQRPSPQRMLVWLAAVLIQFASLNYWTVHNIFFVAIILGCYMATHWNQCVRLGARVRGLRAVFPRGVALAAAAAAIVVLAWTVLIVSASVDQAGKNIRYVYSPQNAMERVQEIRRYTTELFNPVLDRPVKLYRIINEMHNARYIGVVLLPLIGIAIFASMRRRTRWLLASGALILGVCLATPVLVLAWSVIPFMDRIQHVFYFYSLYWQLLAVLLAAAGLDVLLASPSRNVRRVALWLLGAGAAFALWVMANAALESHRYPPGDVNLESNLRAALLLGIASALLFRAVWSTSRREKVLAVAAVLWLAFIDLSAYFHNASRTDMLFTATRPWVGAMPTPEHRVALRKPWGPPQPERGFSAGLTDYLPITNEFWPVNTFMLPAGLSATVAEAYRLHAASSPAVMFYDRAVPAPAEAPVPESLARDFKAFERELHLAGYEPSKRMGAATAAAGGDFSFRWNLWRYNEFELDVTAPRDGWVLIRQLHDPKWRVSVDGEDAAALKANYLSMAVAVPSGKHVVRWEYKPLARRVYWIAAFLLEAVVAIFLALALALWRKPGT